MDHDHHACSWLICVVREIEPVNPPENQTQFSMAYYVINYSKLRIWEFVEYSKIIYLDGDIQVFGNIDHLFDLGNGHFHAVMDCFCERSWSNSPQYNIVLLNASNYRKSRVIMAAVFKISAKVHCSRVVSLSFLFLICQSSMGRRPPFYFNAGMFIFEPNLSVYDHLLSTLVITPASTFAEQDYLNMFFKDTYKPITLTYNLGLPMLWRHPEHVDLERTKVVRYCAAGSKPWKYTGKEENMEREDIKMLVTKWWEIYNDESLDYGNSSANGHPLRAALLEAGVVHYIAAPSAA
ncbi:galactinol synthase 2-like [Vitis riparia]|uniref:galactinol synthase 2-like n=1 Tax=Vitis riparia TaxID=96939 RepID=UPI00155B14D3|nr:galactinol synthase 2-like [Vitis riparia]